MLLGQVYLATPVHADIAALQGRSSVVLCFDSIRSLHGGHMTRARVRDGASLAEQAYDRICTSIIDGSWPPKAPLAQEQIAELLGVSRTPIREALAKAAQDTGHFDSRPWLRG